MNVHHAKFQKKFDSRTISITYLNAIERCKVSIGPSSVNVAPCWDETRRILIEQQECNIGNLNLIRMKIIFNRCALKGTFLQL